MQKLKTALLGAALMGYAFASPAQATPHNVGTLFVVGAAPAAQQVHFDVFLPLRHVDKLEALVRAQTYAFYCLVLAGGIIASQLRGRAPERRGWLRGRFVPALGVAAFFCFLSFFETTHREESLARHAAFLLHVLRVDRWLQTTG